MTGNHPGNTAQFSTVTDTLKPQTGKSAAEEIGSDSR
jgi:hypothetical protein